MLSPLKFTPIFKERVWGGDSLYTIFDKLIPENVPIGESWEISAIEDDQTVVAEGPFEGNEINELVEVYMEQLVGDKVYQKFGNEFPLLVKFIDATHKSSVQVHPNNELAAQLHHSYGKSQIWYIADCKVGAELYIGFKKRVSQDEYNARVADGTIVELLNRFEVNKGDAYFVPAGTVYYIGEGVLALEIGQSSDIAYRIYDWGRDESDRVLLPELAQRALDLNYTKSDFDITIASEVNSSVNLIENEEFTTNLVEIRGEIAIECSQIDSFIIITVVEGEITTDALCRMDAVMAGETILIPAQADRVVIKGVGKFVETYI